MEDMFWNNLICGLFQIDMNMKFYSIPSQIYLENNTKNIYVVIGMQNYMFSFRFVIV